jgi:hypothetical protein
MIISSIADTVNWAVEAVVMSGGGPDGLTVFHRAFGGHSQAMLAIAIGCPRINK